MRESASNSVSQVFAATTSRWLYKAHNTPLLRTVPISAYPRVYANILLVKSESIHGAVAGSKHKSSIFCCNKTHAVYVHRQRVPLGDCLQIQSSFVGCFLSYCDDQCHARAPRSYARKSLPPTTLVQNKSISFHLLVHACPCVGLWVRTYVGG